MSGAYSIARVRARQILDSRAAPTVEADVILASGAAGRAAVPSGTSTGSHEALELRDRDRPEWAGRGVQQAVDNASSIFGPAVIGLDAHDQTAVDAALLEADSTPGFGCLGANAALAVSLATARAAAAALQRPFYAHVAELVGSAPLLPLPMVNMISGGAHAGRNLDIQDVLAIPVGADTYGAGLEMLVRLYWSLRSLLIELGHPPLVGDEGGFGPALGSNEAALSLVTQAMERAGLRPGEDMALALDVAATELYQPQTGDPSHPYRLRHDDAQSLDASGMIDLVETWRRRYPLVSIEDPLAEDDWDGWQRLTARLGAGTQLVGDDLFTTNSTRLRRGIQAGAANAILIKVNQIGTLTGTFETLRLARQHGYRCVISARSGETEDDWLADLAVGCGAGQIKVGSIARSERLAKYNRLLRIEEEGNPAVPYAGNIFGPSNPASY